MLLRSYDADNRLTNRWSAEKGNTAYAYDSVGNLSSIQYQVSSNVFMAYDALNRLTNMVDGIGTNNYTYTAGGQLLTEDGPFASDTVTNIYVNRLRTELDLQQPGGLWTNAFTYDAAKRLIGVASPAGSFTYLFPDGIQHRVSSIQLPNTAYITNTYDSVARLSGTYLNSNTDITLDSYAYTYNAASQRTALTRADASTVAYRYDSIGQLKVADSSVNSEDRGYTYDAAWNLNYRTNNGSPQTFAVNNLNELTGVPGGSTSYDLNGNLTNSPSGNYVYDDENRLVEWNQGGPTTVGALATTFAYDGRGRLRTRAEFRGDGSGWVAQGVTDYIYDGMRVIQERSGDNVARVSYTRGTDLSGSLEGAGGIGGLLARSHDVPCDVSLTVGITNGFSVAETVSIYDDTDTFVDGADMEPGTYTNFTFSGVAGVQYTISGPGDYYYLQTPWYENFTPVQDYYELGFVHGDELEYVTSGSTLCGGETGMTLHEYYFADGNGNVTYLTDTNQAMAASYRYDPFGNTISQSGPLADANVYRFSSKEIHAASGMYYYGYRFYDPGLQRWVNRDPIEEAGGLNLFGFARNDPTLNIDNFGLDGSRRGGPTVMSSGGDVTVTACPPCTKKSCLQSLLSGWPYNEDNCDDPGNHGLMIHTGLNSSATIAFPDGTIMRVRELTNINTCSHKRQRQRGRTPTTEGGSRG